MITQNINVNTQIIFVNDPQSEYKVIARELKYTKKDGELYKYVKVDFASMYHPYGASNSLQCIKLTAKNIDTYIVKKSFDFHMSHSHIRNVVNALSHFGGDYVPIIDGVEFDGSIDEVSSDKLQDESGKSISFGEQQETDNTKIIHKMIHRLSTDNGHMLAPIIKRFLNTVHLFKGNKNLLTGYAKLDSYLRMIKQPTTGLIQKNNDDENSNFLISLDDESSQGRVEVVGIRDGKPVVELKFRGTLVKNDSLHQTPDPYVLLTTKPIILGRQRIPYKVVSYRGTPIFISPLIFNSSKVLRDMKGGINLLK